MGADKPISTMLTTWLELIHDDFIKDPPMSNKSGRTLLLVGAMATLPLLMLQGVLLAPPIPPLTLLLVMLCTVVGFFLLLYLTHRLHKAERERWEQRWLQALQLRDPTRLDSPHARLALQQLLASFNNAEEEARRQITELYSLATRDEMTQLGNRHAFRRDLTEWLQQEESQTSILVLIRATELGRLNAQYGFQSGDAYIKDIANLIHLVINRFQGQRVYRISGSDFAVLLPADANIPPHLLGQEFKRAFDHYHRERELENVAYAGITLLSRSQNIEAILSRADLALARAQTETVNGWAIQQHDHASLHGQQHWRSVLDELLSQPDRIILHYQPIQALNRDMVPYQQVFARFSSREGIQFPTDTLFAMAQRLDMLMRLEQMLITHVIRHYRTFDQQYHRWGINLSSALLQNSAFLIWFDHQLQKDGNISANLVFALDEDQLKHNLAGGKRLFELLRRQGSRSAIRNFGKGMDSFTLLHELRPDYVKLDPLLLGTLERDITNQQFVQMIVDMCHRMDCLVIAEGVEEVAQKELLQGMYADGLQGGLIARPQELRPDSSYQGLFTGDVSTSTRSV